MSSEEIEVEKILEINGSNTFSSTPAGREGHNRSGNGNNNPIALIMEKDEPKGEGEGKILF